MECCDCCVIGERDVLKSGVLSRRMKGRMWLCLQSGRQGYKNAYDKGRCVGVLVRNGFGRVIS